MIGCVGGGSNFAGITFPFIREKFQTGRDTRFVAAEPAACPTLTKGVYAYDYGDTIGMTPLMPMYTLGHDFAYDQHHRGELEDLEFSEDDMQKALDRLPQAPSLT